MSDVVLDVRDLSVAYARAGRPDNLVVSGVSFSLPRASILGMAGESGCGKSTTALAAIGYRAPGVLIESGQSILEGTDLLTLKARDLRSVWGNRVSYVAQNATTALNPALRVGEQLAQPLRLHTGLRADELLARQVELFEQVHIPEAELALDRYPHQFSGGQQQRIAIAIAISCNPDVLVLDEPTTGLDVTTQAKISALLRELVETTGVSAIYVSHDLSLLSTVADDMAVMYGGEIVELGTVSEFARQPTHPYSRALLASVPSVNERQVVTGIPGRPPLSVVLDSCSFAPRCDFAVEPCRAGHVDLVDRPGGGLVRCLRAQDVLHADVAAAAPSHPTVGPALLEVDDLVAHYGGAPQPVLHAVSLTVGKGETLGVVGESGSGKSTLLRCIAGIHPPSGGEIRYDGAALVGKAVKRPREVRRAMQLVFQNPETSLNPRHTVAEIVGRPIHLFRDDVKRSQVEGEVLDLLDQVKLPREVLHRFPSELSGGQKQRVSLARAFAARPSVLLCDEVTSALDVSVQATILQLIADLAAQTGASVVFVSHDLAVVRTVAQRSIVMKDGRIVEEGETDALFVSPQHPYTQQLLAAIPDIKVEA